MVDVLIGIVIMFVGIFILLVLYLVPFKLYLAAFSSNVKVGLTDMVAMRFRGVNPHDIVNPLIQAVKGGLTDITVAELEAHYLSGGDVFSVVQALISAKKAGLNLNFRKAAAIDLAGRNVYEAVRMCVNPKIIKTPPITAVAKDGIQVRATARVTVRANINKLIGGAGEDTIIARVGEGICTTIGSAENHKIILEKPELISETILKKGLDAQTAFEILSIDIADVDVGKNIGSILQIDQANADKRVANARAEERRANAVAREKEMEAMKEEMKALLIEAEAEVPKSIAESILQGRIE